MIVGGSDLILCAPPGVPATALVVDRLRRFWPESRFQDVDEETDRDIHDPWVTVHGSRCVEFFICRDRAAVVAWDRDGATTANLDTMLYFIIRDDPEGRDGLQEVTLVCGKKTRAIRRLIDDLTQSFRSSRIPAPARAA